MNPDSPAPDETAPTSPEAGGPLEAIIAAYLLAEDRGEAPDRAALLAAHPEQAAALGDFFREHDRFARLAKPLRGDDLTASLPTGAEATPGATPPTVRYFGDYELQEVIGQGGMGVVYRARQLSLNRPVAVKMLRAGVLASDDDLRRFQNEAEAVALLDHPHIVPIHEVGRHEGRPYFAMKLIPGTSLDKALPSFANHFREIADLVAHIAEAVHHAHQRGILHRDLKPANILLDPQGHPSVTDFGLAKKVTADADLTLTGAILGTPAYMAPEQAGRQRGLVTTATDVYGLGAILYALLTGQAPFRGESIPDTLHQVLTTAPVHPSRSNPRVPRDLATICLKCLDKDPHRRYPSADALTLDLRRYLAGEPITARPTGPAERLLLWTRRNPAVATVAASLFLGTMISTYFAVRESRRAQAESRERTRAEKAEQAALAERDATEQTLAQSLGGPLDPEGDHNDKEILSQPEAEALWKLATAPSDRLGLRFLAEAIRSPLATRQLRARSEPAMIAAVGLDPSRRIAARALLADRLRDPALTSAHGTDIALIALELEDQPDATTELIIDAIRRGYAAGPPEYLREEWADHLKAIVTIDTIDTEAIRLDPVTTFQAISLAIQAEKSPELGQSLLSELIKLTPKVPPPLAARTFLDALRLRPMGASAALSIATSLPSLAARLPRHEVNQLYSHAAEAIQSMMEEAVRAGSQSPQWKVITSSLLEALVRVVDAMDQADAITTSRNAIQSLKSVGPLSNLSDFSGYRYPSKWVIQLVIQLLNRIEPDEAIRFCQEALEGETDLDVVVALERTIIELASRLDPNQARAIREAAERRVFRALDCENNETRQRIVYYVGHNVIFSQAYESGIELLPPPTASRSLLNAYHAEANPEFRMFFVEVLGRFTLARLDPAEAARLLVTLLKEEKDEGIRNQLNWSRYQVASHLDAPEAVRIQDEGAPKLLAWLPKIRDRNLRLRVAGALLTRPISPELPAHQDFRRSIANAYCTKLDRFTFDWKDLGILARQVGEAEFMSVFAPIARRWMESLDRSTRPEEQQELLEYLSHSFLRLSRKDLSRAIEMLMIGRQWRDDVFNSNLVYLFKDLVVSQA